MCVFSSVLVLHAYMNPVQHGVRVHLCSYALTPADLEQRPQLWPQRHELKLEI